MFCPKSIFKVLLFTVLLCLVLLPFACKEKKNAREAAAPATMTIDSITGAPARLPNPWQNAGCKLVTDEEVIKMFNIEVDRYAFNSRTLPDLGYCLRSWLKPNWKELESANEKPGATYVEFKNTLVTQVLDYGTEVASYEQFEMKRRDQRNIFEEDVDGLGDAAIWSTSQQSLMVKKGHLVVSITLDYTERQHDNLELAKKIAQLALRKMN